jgi:hypothetical protein
MRSKDDIKILNSENLLICMNYTDYKLAHSTNEEVTDCGTAGSVLSDATISSRMTRQNFRNRPSFTMPVQPSPNSTQVMLQYPNYPII